MCSPEYWSAGKCCLQPEHCKVFTCFTSELGVTSASLMSTKGSDFEILISTHPGHPSPDWFDLVVIVPWFAPWWVVLTLLRMRVGQIGPGHQGNWVIMQLRKGIVWRSTAGQKSSSTTILASSHLSPLFHFPQTIPQIRLLLVQYRLSWNARIVGWAVMSALGGFCSFISGFRVSQLQADPTRFVGLRLSS